MARLPVPGSDNNSWGDVLNEYLSVTHNPDGTLKASAVEATGVVGSQASAVLNVGIAIDDPTRFGGSYAANTWTIGVLSAFSTSGDSRLFAVLGSNQNDVLGSASSGLFEHTGSGIFERVRSWSIDDIGLLIVAQIEINPGDGSIIAWFHTNDGSTLACSTLHAMSDASSLEAQVGALETRLNRYYPANPVVPHLHISKYVTFDPDFPLDGSATHVGGQIIDNGQNITILSNNSGNGGVWTLSTSGPATRAQGFGAMVSSDIGNYDHVSYTGTRWAYFSLFRLLGDATQKGLAPVPPNNSGVFGGLGVNKVYRPDLIATTISGNTLAVLEPDGSTSNLSISVDLAEQTICVFVIDTLEMVTIADGSVVMAENFTSAEGVWIAMGAATSGENTIVATNGHNDYSVLTVSPDLKIRLDDFEARITALEGL